MPNELQEFLNCLSNIYRTMSFTATAVSILLLLSAMKTNRQTKQFRREMQLIIYQRVTSIANQCETL